MLSSTKVSVRVFAWARFLQRTDDVLKFVPNFVAVLALPVLIEAAFAECVSERRAVDIYERNAFGLQVRAQGIAELGDVLPLLNCRLVDLLHDDVAEVRGQASEG